MLGIDSFITLFPKVKKDADELSFINRLTVLSHNLTELLDELEDIIDRLKKNNNIDIMDEARRIERSRKKRIMEGIGLLALIAIIIGVVVIYMLYIKNNSHEEYISTNENNRSYVENKPTFTENDRAVLDLIVDLDQVSKEVNIK
jgi:hypothetical protein